MKIKNLGKKNTIFNHFISEIRDVDIQLDSMRFRRNIERIGEVFAYEISKELNYTNVNITTPLGDSNESLMLDTPVLATILRAGIPLHQGLLNYFDKSDSAFISAYRKRISENNFEIKIEYMSSPDLNNKTVILCDPMIASGSSMVMAMQAILSKANPSYIHVVGIIASSEGLEYLKENAPVKNYTIWIGAEDSEMNAKSYIIPGLGDAGDLSYGEKK
tara:strand:- start:627 stop:1280 length:654 start_codon:yes stop_codon:yes gene_type:complete